MKRLAALLPLLALACLPAAAQTNAPAAEAVPDAASAPAAAGAEAADLAEAALRDGIPSLAFAEATNALASAESPEAARHAFEVAAAALERTAPPEAVLAWLDSLPDGDSSGEKDSRRSPLVTRHSPPAAWSRARALSALGRHAEAAAVLAPVAVRKQPGLQPAVDQPQAVGQVVVGGFVAAHIVAVSVAVACNLMTILGQIAETAPVGVPVHYQVEGGLVSVLVEQRTRIAHMARCAVVERERNGALAEARPSSDFHSRNTETTGHSDTDRLPCHLVSRDLISIGL